MRVGANVVDVRERIRFDWNTQELQRVFESLKYFMEVGDCPCMRVNNIACELMRAYER